jgi:hypothetical protein
MGPFRSSGSGIKGIRFPLSDISDAIFCLRSLLMNDSEYLRPLPWQIAYEYTCKTSGPQTMTDCEELGTAPNDGGEGGNIVEFLDRHAVTCPADKVISHWCYLIISFAEVKRF